MSEPLDDPPPAALVVAMGRLIGRVVAHDFDGLCADGAGGRLAATDFARIVARYPYALVPLPVDWPASIRFSMERDDGEWCVDVPVWTAEEGMSDLTLSLRGRLVAGSWQVTVNDFLVP